MKLYSGAGDGIVHSKERPSHGSAGAVIGFLAVAMMLIRNTNVPIPMKNAPTVETKLPTSRSYPG
ncbi:hypothetical protein D3C85_1673240 [compost metagenome]